MGNCKCGQWSWPIFGYHYNPWNGFGAAPFHQAVISPIGHLIYMSSSCFNLFLIVITAPKLDLELRHFIRLSFCVSVYESTTLFIYAFINLWGVSRWPIFGYHYNLWNWFGAASIHWTVISSTVHLIYMSSSCFNLFLIVITTPEMDLVLNNFICHLIYLSFYLTVILSNCHFI